MGTPDWRPWVRFVFWVERRAYAMGTIGDASLAGGGRFWRLGFRLGHRDGRC